MKSITSYLIPCTLIALMACNSGDDKAETKSTTTETTTTTPANTTPTTTTPKEEPKKTNVSVGPGGASVDTKKGTSVKVDSSGVKVGSKDVIISVNPKKKN
jgi:hypothetical protein